MVSSVSAIPPAVSANDRLAVLIVEDEPTMRTVLQRGLRLAGCVCATAANGHEALAALQEQPYDVLLCDIRMPGISGLELLPRALNVQPDLLIIMVTALAGLQTAINAFRAGAFDFVTKPFQMSELEGAIDRARAHIRVRETRRTEKGSAPTPAPRGHSPELAVITSLCLALEAKDPWTHDHSRRVSELAGRLGQQLGLSEIECADLRLAGILHDVGKIGVPMEVLHKATGLTEAEFIQIRQHSDLSARILAPVAELKHLLPMIRHHHERWDGAGYPDQLAGEAIPFGARILAVADTWSALRERRPYRRGMTRERAMNEMVLGSLRQFDRRVLGALISLYDRGILDEVDAAFPDELPFVSTPGSEVAVARGGY